MPFEIPSPYSVDYLQTIQHAEDTLNSVHGDDFCWHLFIDCGRNWPLYFAAIEALYLPKL